MESQARNNFVNNYSRLLTTVWSDESFAELLAASPVEVLSDYGMEIAEGARVELVRDGAGEPDLEAQISAWEKGAESGVYTLFVPASPVIETQELSEAELEAVAGGDGGNTAISCCCTPCCCCSGGGGTGGGGRETI
ncbi:hypothetical protein GCM10009665_75730 [Kitasatospora nipponensis]|uniref:NHLP leader peptide family natural product n=1 Tax=Kitasatospora nipponensis TaxID=258049 RepID=A0ABN1T848_9ACTN